MCSVLRKHLPEPGQHKLSQLAQMTVPVTVGTEPVGCCAIAVSLIGASKDIVIKTVKKTANNATFSQRFISKTYANPSIAQRRRDKENK